MFVSLTTVRQGCRTHHRQCCRTHLDFPLSGGKPTIEDYRLDQLVPLLEERGATLWECDLQASGWGTCPECDMIFERTNTARQYCSDRCRGRANSRRWREIPSGRAGRRRSTTKKRIQSSRGRQKRTGAKLSMCNG